MFDEIYWTSTLKVKTAYIHLYYIPLIYREIQLDILIGHIIYKDKISIISDPL